MTTMKSRKPRQSHKVQPPPDASRSAIIPGIIEVDEDRALLVASGQFDTRFYLDTYPDVAGAGIDPVTHFLVHGAREERNPNPHFSTRDYNAARPEVKACGMNPLLHAIRTGFFEDRLCSLPGCVQPVTTSMAKPVVESDIENAHSVLLGRPIVSFDIIDANLGRSSTDLITALLASDAFSVDIAESLHQHAKPAFKTSHASVSPSLIAWAKSFFGIERQAADQLSQPLQWPVLLDVLFHDPAFLRVVMQSAPKWAGDTFLASLSDFARSCTWPDELQRDYDIIAGSNAFDTAYYLAQYPDVLAADIDPIRHYLTHGAAEARDPSADFSTFFYFRENHDVASSGVNPLVHYILEGRQQGRRPRTARYVPAPVPFSAVTMTEAPSGDVWRASFAARLEQRIAALGHADLSPPLETSRSDAATFGAYAPDTVAPTRKKLRASASSVAGTVRRRQHADADAATAIQIAPITRPTFSVTMTVFDTDPAFLRELASTVRAQAFTDFEWLILDNGSRSRDTIELCKEIAASDPRFRLFRVEDNLHIIGGNRYVFERAQGHYVVPIDSDDLLYPDSLALFADVLREVHTDPPVLLYSDEQKVDRDGQPLELIWRWGFSFAHAMSTVSAAHLMAFSREVARDAGIYTDDYARGSHDWDTMLRIAERGGTIRHVPEVLYGWRVHEASTASASTAKDYIIESQSAVLAHSLSRRCLDHLFDVKDLFPGVLGWYHAYRRKTCLPLVMVDIVVEAPFWNTDNLLHNLRQVSSVASICRVLYPLPIAPLIELTRACYPDLSIQHWVAYATPADLEQELNALQPGLFAKAIISNDVRLKSSEAILDAIGTLELDVQAGVVGGPVVLGDIVSSIGLLGGLNDFVASPFAGCHRHHIPGSLLAVRRPVTAFPIKAIVIRASLIESGVRVCGMDNQNSLTGLLFCLEAMRRGYTAVYTFQMETEIRYGLPVSYGADPDIKAVTLHDYAREIARTAHSTHLSHRAECFGRLKSPIELGQAPPYDTARLSPAIPLNFQIQPSLAALPTVNLLLPAVRMVSMSGGPNTALNVGYRLAAQGFAVRIFSTDVPTEADLAPVWKHIVSNGGGTRKPAHLEIVDASDRSKPVSIGANDVFFATAWWTAQMANWARPLVANRPFIYLIQDFEPILYSASSAYALAQETYGFNYLPAINTKLLRDYLVENRVGKFSDPEHCRRSITFEPAIAAKSFYYSPRIDGRRTLLFYARPTSGIRNLFEIGIAAIQTAIDQGVFDPEEWSFIGMGEPFTPFSLGRGAMLECAPWLGFDDYAVQMRQADILLSLMLSPHPSYPPLEMAACGGLVVTNAYGNKTTARMAEISPNILAAEPTITGVTDAIRTAVGRLQDMPSREAGARLGLPATWDESFQNLLPAIVQELTDLGVHPDSTQRPPPGEPRELAAPRAEAGCYATFLDAAVARRAIFNAPPQEPGLLSFVTTVWNTAPAFLDVLAESVRIQAGGTEFEWYVLDNGTTRTDTRALLAKLAEEPYVRLERVEVNLGIIGGMRHCLHRATGRYILPLDSDDYLFPDCVQTLTWYMQKHGYPALLYTDEDKLVGEQLFLPYLKPDFDPVLFTNSCYIAHLGAIDRVLALELDIYSDPATEGSHDWDTFTRFLNAGHTPVHVPEVLYSWRMHPQSTAGDINSKPVVYESQQAVLRRFLDAQPLVDRFELRKSPLFNETPDWWMRRRRIEPRPLTTLLIRNVNDGGMLPTLRISDNVDHEVIEVMLDGGPAAMLPHVIRCAVEGRLVHTLSSETYPTDDEWYWEAMGVMDLFPSTVCVGGRIHSHGTVLEAGRFLGFGDGCGCPDRGRLLTDPGFSAQMWKQHSVGAISAMHAIFDARFLAEVIQETLDEHPSIANLGAWAGAVARRKGRRVVYSPIVDAHTTIDWDALVTTEERGRFVLRFADIMPDVELRSPHLGLTKALAYEPMDAPHFNPAAQGIVLPSYGAWQKTHLAARLARTRSVTNRSCVDFSVLTTLYHGTDAALFCATAATVLEQTHRRFEWVVLAHGPISQELDLFLRTIVADKRVRVLRLATNLGIMGGMRHVLEAATADYVVPLDGDDLLALDAFQLLAAAIDGAPEPPAYLYTDEDIIVGTDARSPYLRPDWDPVLDLENSWIWHVGAFRRDLALKVGAYTDHGSEYCHDWDTVYRFSLAGHQPLHLRDIAYHWRHHERSTSASENPNQGSAAAVKSLLQLKITNRGLDAVCQVAPYPLWRGALEWWIERKAEQLPPLTALVFGETSAAGPAPVEGLYIQAMPSGHFVRTLRDAVDHLPDAAIVLLANGAGAVPDTAAFLEAIKLFEFVDELVAVSGRLLRGSMIAAAGFVTDETGRLSAPYDGRAAGDPGPYALAWKPQCIAVPVPGLCFVRAIFLKAAVVHCPDHCTLQEFGLWLGAMALAGGKLVGYSPLIVGQEDNALPGGFDSITTQVTWNAFLRNLPTRPPLCRGAAGYGRLIPT